MEFRDFTDKLKELLELPLPGTDIQWQMASSDRKVKGFPRHRKDDTRLAAVLILMYPVSGKINTVFIQRPVYNGAHSGQISFPGGKMEQTDHDIVETAKREACEETGVCSNKLDILGKLTPLYIPVSNMEVTPVIASLETKPIFKPSKREVVKIIEADLHFFLNPSVVKEKEMLIMNENMIIRYYDFNQHMIWGATAMMLHELLFILSNNNMPLLHG